MQESDPKAVISGTTHDAEQQRELMERILASSQFRRSPRLSAFLRFICKQEWEGLAEQLNEQRVGVRAFGRPEGYHVGEDSIVRSQARLLRQRLDDYFVGEGKDEPIRLTVPKGSYVPRYAARTLEPESPKQKQHEQEAGEQAVVTLVRLRQRMWPRLILSSVLGIVLLAVVSILAYRHWLHTQEAAESSFWNSILNVKRGEIIVPSDSSLVLIEEMNNRQVSLDDYISHRYLDGHPERAAGANSGEVARTVAMSQYTNLADLNLSWRLEQLASARHVQAQIRYARELTMRELKASNVILIGGPRSNPWVELFEPSMDFIVDYDTNLHLNLIRNRRPQAGEKEQYIEENREAEHEAYGVVAYLPSLDGQGSALLVGGTSKAGTEAAAEFLFSSGFQGLLEHIARGHGLSHFEILIATENSHGESHGSRVICFHRL